MIPALRQYQPLWEQIKRDKLAAIQRGEKEYAGTLARDISPALARRIDKAVRKEKNSFDGTNWPLGRYLKLQSEYNPETFEFTFRLVNYRKYEALARLTSKLL